MAHKPKQGMHLQLAILNNFLNILAVLIRRLRYKEQVRAFIVNKWKQGVKHNSACLFNQPVQR